MSLLLKSTLIFVFIQSVQSTTCSSAVVTTGPCFTDGATTTECGTTAICATTATGLQCCPFAFAVTNSSTSTTTTPACVDKRNAATGVSDCAARAAIGYCTRRYYVTLMKQQCRRTCGFCTVSSSTTYNGTCYDRTNPSTGVSDCTRLSYLCTNSIYYSVMLSQCPLTCGFCTSG